MENIGINSDVILDLVEFSESVSSIKKTFKKQYIDIDNNIKKTVVKLKRNNEFNKPEGEYITYDVNNEFVNSHKLSAHIYDDLKRLIKKYNKILFIGIGNEVLTSDSLGPRAVDLVDITEEGRVFKLNPNVAGNTGIESDVLIKSVVNIVRPDVIIAIDSLASRSFNRVGTSFQISTAGITPGSGSGKTSVQELSVKTLGIPVIAIGVPMVVHVNSFMLDLINGLNLPNIDSFSLVNSINEKLGFNGMIMAPKEVDYLIEFCSSVIGKAINLLIK